MTNDALVNIKIEDPQQRIAELLAALEKRDAQIATLSKESLAKSAELQRLQQKLQALLHRLYGRRSEKDHPGQLFLFNQNEAAPTPPVESPAPDDESVLAERQLEFPIATIRNAPFFEHDRDHQKGSPGNSR